MKKRIVYLVLSAASVVLAYGKPIEIRGYLLIVLWIIPAVFMIVCIKNNTKLFRGAFIAMLVCYFISSGLFFLRNHGGVKVVRTERSGSSVVEYCDINTGATGSVRCRRTEYFSVIESKLLSILIPKSVKVFRGKYADLGG